MKNRKNLMIDPENDIHVTIASIQDLSDYGTSVYQALKQVYIFHQHNYISFA